MNATTNFTVKSLRANKVRTLVTIAGVALAAASAYGGAHHLCIAERLPLSQ